MRRLAPLLSPSPAPLPPPSAVGAGAAASAEGGEGGVGVGAALPMDVDAGVGAAQGGAAGTAAASAIATGAAAFSASAAAAADGVLARVGGGGGGSSSAVAAVGAAEVVKEKEELFCLCRRPYDAKCVLFCAPLHMPPPLSLYPRPQREGSAAHPNRGARSRWLLVLTPSPVPYFCKRTLNRAFVSCRVKELKFMISCEICEEWFHPRCVGLTHVTNKSTAARWLPAFVCPKCCEGKRKVYPFPHPLMDAVRALRLSTDSRSLRCARVRLLLLCRLSFPRSCPSSPPHTRTHTRAYALTYVLRTRSPSPHTSRGNALKQSRSRCCCAK